MSKSVDVLHNKKILYYCMITIIIISLMQVAIVKSTSAKDVQKGIAKEIVRFHILANSDSEEDQNLKLQVKEKIIYYMSELLKDARSKEEVENIMFNNLDKIKEVAEKVIIEKNYNYKVKVSLGKHEFPTKIYGDMTFPPGIYDALRVEIGEAKGKNWWCVMFPPLCLVDSVTHVVPKKSKTELKHVLTDTEYKELVKNKKVKVKIKFRIFG